VADAAGNLKKLNDMAQNHMNYKKMAVYLFRVHKAAHLRNGDLMWSPY
jgi:hypothetical protein